MKALVATALTVSLAACVSPAAPAPAIAGQAFCCDSLESSEDGYARGCAMILPNQLEGCAEQGRVVLQCGGTWALRPPVASDGRRPAISTTDAMCLLGPSD